MIYFDNSATTITKPPEVADAVAFAINNFGSAGRSFYDAGLMAGREIFKTRMEIAELIGLADPLGIAFTSSFTESLNLVAGGLIAESGVVVTTVSEHNSVLRPLYLSGCELHFIDCDDNGTLRLDMAEKLLKPPTKFLFVTHGSNLTGNITDVRTLYNSCRSNGITMIFDVSQTLGVIPVNIDMADIFCFSGHKGLFGPQGTGGVIVNGNIDFRLVKSGGSGSHSFSKFQSKAMPDVFETGTPNGSGIFGLQKGVRFIRKIGIDRINEKTTRLWNMFYDGIKHISGIIFYGDFSSVDRLPVVALNIDGLTSAELAQRLWEGYGIATRAGIHCVPLLHERFGTADMGIVRFSFSYFNTEEEIETGVSAIREIAECRV